MGSSASEKPILLVDKPPDQISGKSSDSEKSSENPPNNKEKHLRILLVEDDECLQTSVSRCFKEFDEKPAIFWTATGEEALKIIQEQPLDLIIVDYGLAGIANGLEIWEACRRATPRTPFIMMSGLPVESFLDLTRSSGIVPPRFLPKPFYPSELKAIVRECLCSVLGQNPTSPKV